MAKKYFRVIKTSGPADGPIDRQHEEKLENYRKYGYPATNENTEKDLLRKYPDGYDKGYELEIHSQSSTSYMFAHTVNLVTVLCCSNEPYEEKAE